MFNAGVVSYSGMTDYLKIKYLIEVEGFRFNEVFVFYDLSDPYNDYLLEYYEHFTPIDRSRRPTPPSEGRRLFVTRHSFLAYKCPVLPQLRAVRHLRQGVHVVDVGPKRSRPVGGQRPRRVDEIHAATRGAVQKAQLKMTIAVYPWAHLVEKRDLHSRMVSVWTTFAARHAVSLINYFPDFVNDTPSAKIVEQNFRPVDMHWTEHGHQSSPRDCCGHQRRTRIGGLGRCSIAAMSWILPPQDRGGLRWRLPFRMLDGPVVTLACLKIHEVLVAE